MLSNARTDLSRQNRQRILIETNIRWLNQALALLERIDDVSFTASPRGLEPHRAGAHLRHVLEFYGCFLSGMDCGHIDYGARRRDLTLERSRTEAMRRIRQINAALIDSQLDLEDFVVMVRMEDADALGIPGGWLPSSVSRELQTLSSHTIHHFALISVTLRALGVEVDRNFGMAPSTLHFESKMRHSATAA